MLIRKGIKLSLSLLPVSIIFFCISFWIHKSNSSDKNFDRITKYFNKTLNFKEEKAGKRY